MMRRDCKFPSITVVLDILTNARNSDVCATCTDKSQPYWKLEWHARDTGHRPFECPQIECEATFRRRCELARHQRERHLDDLDHGYQSQSRLTCSECNERFDSQWTLYHHARDQQHALYICKCGEGFSRSDVLDRHLKNYVKDAQKFPCTYCKRGDRSFKRRDHLTQHLRAYHHIGVEEEYHPYLKRVCPHASCPQHRGPDFFRLEEKEKQRTKPFDKDAKYFEHMRKSHNESHFPCDIYGCSRVDEKGYFREVDLLKHRKKEHPEAPRYESSKRPLLLSCADIKCKSFGKPLFADRMELYKHYAGDYDCYLAHCTGSRCTQEEAYQKAGYTLRPANPNPQANLDASA